MLKAFVEQLIASLPFLERLPASLVHIVVIFVAALVLIGVVSLYGLIAVYAERKISAWIQDRIGPNRVGPFGLLQTIADGIKLLLKEDIVPHKAHHIFFTLSPLIVFLSAFIIFAAFPFSGELIAADLNVGIFYILAIGSLASVGVLMGGWASNNKWSLLGGMRAAAQIVSYEIPVSLAILPIVMIAGTLNLREIVETQSGGIWNWHLVSCPPFGLIGFVIFLVATLAEVNRLPFDLPEAESEIIGGYHTEYSGMKFAFFFLAEYAEMFVVSGLATIFFLGGWHSPFGSLVPFLDQIPGVVWMLGKIALLLFVQIWLRWCLPRLRVDQLMYLSWKVLTPFAFANILCVGLWLLWRPTL